MNEKTRNAYFYGLLATFIVAGFWIAYWLLVGSVPNTPSLQSDDTPAFQEISHFWDILIVPIALFSWVAFRRIFPSRLDTTIQGMKTALVWGVIAGVLVDIAALISLPFASVLFWIFAVLLSAAMGWMSWFFDSRGMEAHRPLLGVWIVAGLSSTVTIGLVAGLPFFVATWILVVATTFALFLFDFAADKAFGPSDTRTEHV